MTSSTKTIPPLENGDRLTRAEFEQRYESMSQLKKAEVTSSRLSIAQQ